MSKRKLTAEEAVADILRFVEDDEDDSDAKDDGLELGDELDDCW